MFPRYGIRELDAVILTHGHADACYGMDALRQWTLGGAVQKHIDIFLSSETMDTIATTFPFLVDARNATGKLNGMSTLVHTTNDDHHDRWW